MPYSSHADIPANVAKSLHTAHEKDIWIAAWNAAHGAGHDESSCFAIALAAVEKYRAKHAKG